MRWRKSHAARAAGVEEAHQVAFDISRREAAKQLNMVEGVFDEVAAEAAGCNLCPVFMARSPAMLSDGVRKSVGLLVTLKLVSEASDKPRPP